jgi:hypothetical protein
MERQARHPARGLASVGMAGLQRLSVALKIVPTHVPDEILTAELDERLAAEDAADEEAGITDRERRGFGND